ncbi:MAG: glycosyltransferase family 4 protein [Chloroflexota bacterium]|nr:glycosyltransferase family 4 protein [Chloroflexota bacterium]
MAKTAFVSTYPPQRCGIATFTSDLALAVGDREIVAIQPPEKPGFYPVEVSRRVARDVPADYLSAARWIDARPFDVVSLQHEYGIWGGPDGAYVLDFIEALRTPVVATLHTVLQNPTPSQRRILTELVHLAAETVVMSTAAASLLTRSYGIDPTRLEIVPHGVPQIALAAPDSVKPQLGLAGHTVILSFGLLGPGKGYESAIAAMPAVVRADQTALYVIVGATHPDLLRREGEAYRNQLARLAASLGVADRVRFVGRYVAASELAMWLTAADIFVTPYPNLEQIVSGTLSYAMGAGKAIVSTPYAYATERLAQGRGRLVAAGSSEALAEGLIELALNGKLRAEYGQRAYAHSEGMHWPEIGVAYRRIFSRIAGVPGVTGAAGVAGVKPRREGVAVLADRAVVAGA